MAFDPDAYLKEKDSGFDPDEYLSAARGPKLPESSPEKGLGSRALDAAISGLEFVDSYTGAPTRAAIDAGIDGKNPFSAFADNFGDDPKLAPTGKTIAEKLGASTAPLREHIPSLSNKDSTPYNLAKNTVSSMIPIAGPMVADKVVDFVADASPAGIAGLGVDVAADWTNLVGAGLVKGGAKALSQAGKTAAREGAKSAVHLAAVEAPKLAAKGVDKITGSEVGTEALEGLKAFVTPKQADDWARLKSIAEANEIDLEKLPPSVEFGDRSLISRLDRQLSEGPIGQAKLENFDSTADSVQDAISSRISKISGRPVLDEIEAGRHLRDAYDRGVDNFFKQIDISHNAIIDMVPGLPIDKKAQAALDSKMAGIEKYAKGLTRRGITKTDQVQGRQLLAAIDQMRNANGSYKQLNEARAMIGRAAFKSKNRMADITPDVEKLQDLYFAIDDALTGTAKARLGDKIADQLVANNKMMSEFFSDKGLLAPVMGAKGVADEKAFKALVQNADSKKIAALKKIIPKEDLQVLKGAFLESLIKRNPDGSFSGKRLRAALQGKKNQLNALFEPGELEGIQDLIIFAERMGEPVLSSSGTGASNALRNLGSSVVDAIGGNTLIDKMKSAARGKGPLALPEPQPSAIPGALVPSTPPPKPSTLEQMKGAFSEQGLTPLSDGPRLNAARAGAAAAKLGATSQANERPDAKLVDMIDVNPGLLESITNPNLKRMLEREVRKRRDGRGESAVEDLIRTSTQDPDQSFIEGN